MRFDGGWIKLHRGINTSEIANDGYAYCLFIKLLTWANRADGRYKGKPLLRGQLVTGVRELSEVTSFGLATVHRKLILLEKLGMVERKRTKWGSVITICNYLKYQDEENASGTQKVNPGERKGNARGTLGERERNHIGELENLRKGEEEKEERDSPPPGDPLTIIGEATKKKTKAKSDVTDPGIIAIAEEWFKHACEQESWRPQQGEWSVQGFARAIVEVSKATDLNYAGLRELMKFIKNNEFWRKNARGPCGLLKLSKQNGSRKIDNILIEMRPKDDLIQKAFMEMLGTDRPIEIMKF